MVVDLAMPDMNGTVFAVRARKFAPDTPVLFVTGYAEVALTSQLPGDDLLKKPFDSAELTAKLAKILKDTDIRRRDGGRGTRGEVGGRNEPAFPNRTDQSFVN